MKPLRSIESCSRPKWHASFASRVTNIVKKKGKVKYEVLIVQIKALAPLLQCDAFEYRNLKHLMIGAQSLISCCNLLLDIVDDIPYEHKDVIFGYIFRILTRKEFHPGRCSEPKLLEVFCAYQALVGRILRYALFKLKQPGNFAVQLQFCARVLSLAFFVFPVMREVLCSECFDKIPEDITLLTLDDTEPSSIDTGPPSCSSVVDSHKVDFNDDVADFFRAWSDFKPPKNKVSAFVPDRSSLMRNMTWISRFDIEGEEGNSYAWFAMTFLAGFGDVVESYAPSFMGSEMSYVWRKIPGIYVLARFAKYRFSRVPIASGYPPTVLSGLRGISSFSLLLFEIIQSNISKISVLETNACICALNIMEEAYVSAARGLISMPPTLTASWTFKVFQTIIHHQEHYLVLASALICIYNILPKCGPQLRGLLVLELLLDEMVAGKLFFHWNGDVRHVYYSILAYQVVRIQTIRKQAQMPSGSGAEKSRFKSRSFYDLKGIEDKELQIAEISATETYLPQCSLASTIFPEDLSVNFKIDHRVRHVIALAEQNMLPNVYGQAQVSGQYLAEYEEIRKAAVAFFTAWAAAHSAVPFEVEVDPRRMSQAGLLFSGEVDQTVIESQWKSFLAVGSPPGNLEYPAMMYHRVAFLEDD